VKKQSKEIDARIVKMGERLKKMRIEKGYKSYEHFAFDNEIGRHQYWRIERGANFTMETLLRILDIYKISIEEFFKGIK
jgi:transcriptional regulator with XRE-family HTH domain